jgi:photosystem II stability/assembly factor-like uncharacterized protein
MKKRTLIFLALLLAACATPRTGADTQASPTLTVPITVPFSLTETLMPTPGLALQDTPTSAASPQQPGILSIMRLQMIDANIGWAEGGLSNDGSPNPNVNSDASYYLLRTTDGGETWQDVTPPSWFNPSLGYGAGISLSAIDANTAWAVSSGYPFSDNPPYTVVWRTIDGGKSWRPGNPISTVSGSPHWEFSPWLQFVDEKHGWLTLHFQQRIESNDLQYRTSDGGITWIHMSGCYTWDGARWGCDVPQFTDSQTGWLRSPPDYTSTGDVDPSSIWRVQRTQDGGQTWQNMALPHSQDAASCYQSFARVGATTVGMRVNCTTPAGITESYYYLSADQGQTWRSIPLPGNAFSLIPPTQAYETSYFNVSTTGNAFFLDMTTGWRLSMLDSNYLLERTTDGGETWQKMADNLAWKDSFQFVDANTGWVVTESPVMELQRTSDGGRTWVKLEPRFLPANAEKPAIARLETGYPLVFKSIQMMDNLNGWAIGANGYIFHTDDAGKNWQDITPRYGYVFVKREFFALDTQRAWIAVSSLAPTMIWYTDDGGQTWHQISTLSKINGQLVSITNIQFLDGNIGWYQWADSKELHLMKTKDNGATWEPQTARPYSPYAMDTAGFAFLDEKNGFRLEPVGEHTLGEFLSGSPALISKTIDGGNNWQLVNLPKMVLDADEISLNQTAYPNGIKELMQDTLMCDNSASTISDPNPNGLTLHLFSPNTIGFRVVCRGGYRDVYNTYGYSFLFVEYYLSTDSGASWNNWMSVGDDIPSEYDLMTPTESEFFLDAGIGWRLKTNQLLHTTDGGKTWKAIKTVGWDEAQFDFINEQEGWALIDQGAALVHTTDGGKTWEELKPVITNQ